MPSAAMPTRRSSGSTKRSNIKIQDSPKSCRRTCSTTSIQTRAGCPSCASSVEPPSNSPKSSSRCHRSNERSELPQKQPAALLEPAPRRSTLRTNRRLARAEIETIGEDLLFEIGRGNWSCIATAQRSLQRLVRLACQPSAAWKSCASEPGHTLDRKDNDARYQRPSNECRRVPRSTARRRRKNNALSKCVTLPLC